MTNQNGVKNVLVLCTANSARSILGEAVFNTLGKDRIRAYSAGSNPATAPHPQALALLERMDYPTDTLSSKSWDSFAGVDAPDMDIIITVCDNAAGETCPIWPGHPVSAHWGLPDPAAETDPTALSVAFTRTYHALEARVAAMLALPLDTLSPEDLRTELRKIGQMDD